MAGLVVCALVGCGTDAVGGDAGGNQTTGATKSITPRPPPPSTPGDRTSLPALGPAAQKLLSNLPPTPESIAADVQRLYPGASITAADVEAQAHSLCRNSFLPFVTMNWIGLRVPQKNLLMLRPAHRLLDLASTAQICTRGPTVAERDQYRRGMFSYLKQAPVRPAGLPVAPDAVQQNVCGFLQNEAGGQAVEWVLEAITKAVRRTADLDVFLPAAVEIAAQTCERWLPLMRDVLNEHFTQ
ncbi:hypothetical protein [Kribbella sp. ALI-6-A]|uniref:hypothetical protein n=1 Tax=Kribbella sp. ALI-6-A TaxID=1933817 RepID=UPI00117A02AB|nr:hypothetical protein [Kribbella sp. ALI-6-A]